MSGNDLRVTYRAADIGDVEALAVLRREFLLEIADADPADASLLPRLRNWFSEKTQSGHFTAILAVVGDEVIASSGLVVHEHPPGIMIPNGREAYIMNMYTRPAWRGRGIATIIFRQLLKVAREKDCTRVALHALPAGRAIYEQEGFKVGDKEMRLDLK
ncbi:MAG TPA: GNAT family N-acetyltransferase [Tepidisphaeraceae bacterium]|jgi:GNAT superfamily N-acetyltransferase|nr:GNAT family N-acetyltransferase [Tepidisphaeraceae bacterium]